MTDKRKRAVSGRELTGETELLGETQPLRHFIHQIPHINCLGVELGILSKESSTNGLSYGTARSLQVLHSIIIIPVERDFDLVQCLRVTCLTLCDVVLQCSLQVDGIRGRHPDNTSIPCRDSYKFLLKYAVKCFTSHLCFCVLWTTCRLSIVRRWEILSEGLK
jgi:hypothetical protein